MTATGAPQAAAKEPNPTENATIVALSV